MLVAPGRRARPEPGRRSVPAGVLLAWTTPPNAPAGPKRIAIITPSHDNPFFKAEAEAAAEQATHARIRGARQFARRRCQQAGPVVSTWRSRARCRRSSSTMPAPTPRSRRSTRRRPPGIPSILIDREINGTGAAAAQIVSNNYQGATLGAEEFVRLMGEAGNYIELVGRESDTNASVRSRGYHDVLDKYPDLEDGRQTERELGSARGVSEDGDADPGQSRTSRASSPATTRWRLARWRR